MKRVHFIAIGGSAMHNLAIALHLKGFVISGSDDEIFEPSKGRLNKHGLLPDKMGWFPDRITDELDEVILGMHARADNPELKKAKELNIPIYSYPEYLYEQSKEKVRVVIGGSHGKTSITSMLLHVLNELNREYDYMVGAQLEGFETMVKLSDAPIIVLEGDEYLSSPMDRRPKFHLYKPNIALLSGIAWDHINVFPTFENYVNQFKQFIQLIEKNGELIYFDGDEQLKKIYNCNSFIHTIPYNTPDYKIKNGMTLICFEGKEYPITVFGKHNLQNILGASLVGEKLGIKQSDFFKAIGSFKGASKRLEKIGSNKDLIVFKDFAHSPSKLKATVNAVREQFPEKKLIACIELHTFSSLNESFIDEYSGCLEQADKAIVYFNPHTIAHKKLPDLSPERVKKAFGHSKELSIYNNSTQLFKDIKNAVLKNAVLLLMSSGNFDGINLDEFAREITT